MKICGIFLLIYCNTIYNSYARYLHHCEWVVDETEFHQPFEAQLATGKFSKEINISKEISQLEVQNLNVLLHVSRQ